jgi:O-antigen/teichoic acid export membrane protein
MDSQVSSSTSQAGSSPENTRVIARNSFWFTLELIFSLFGAFITSVIVARVIGPQRLGNYSLAVWLTNITTAVGAFGLPMTTRKYMAEYMNRGRPGVARSIYGMAMRFQLWIAASVTAVALVIALILANSGLRLVSVLLVMGMAPRMIGFIPSQANNAAEEMRRNTGPTVLGAVLAVCVTLFGLWMGWDLPAVAAATTLAAYLETSLKLRSVRAWLGGVAPEEVPPELRKQMFIYSGQGLALMLLNIVVWDRSDLVFLKLLNKDISQVTFFSMAFNLTERVLLLPNAFAYAVGATMMAQYGRGEERLRQMTVESARYAFLLGLPLLAGMACVSAPAVLLLFREPFRPMIPVLAVVALLAIPKALMAAPTQLLQTTENQGFLVLSGWACGAVNVLLDILLTPRHGALGAAIANGSAQTLAVVLLWVYARRLFHLDLRAGAFARIVVSGMGMAFVAVMVSHALPTYAGLAVAIVAAALTWLLLLRWTGALDGADRSRLLSIGHAAPGKFRPAWVSLVNLLAPEAN